MAEQQFTHLHLHTEYSLLDGACRIEELMKRVKELGQTAVAMTDHGVMYGAIDFYKAAVRHGIQPIIGCEVYIANRSRFDKVNRIDGSYHLVLLCKNEVGYHNLIKLVSAGFTQGFYNKPRIDRELLEQHHEGLIGLSACLAGEVPRALSAGDYEKAVQHAKYYEGVFGKGNYYLEIQNHLLEEQQVILPLFAKLSKDTGIPLVATNDAHYLTREDAKMQRILICIQTNKRVYDDDVMEFGTEEFYVKSTQEMYDLFSAYPEACENTNRIAQMCQFDFEFGVTKLPYFQAPQGMSNLEYFKSLCQAGLEKHYGKQVSNEIRERLEYEIDVIHRMGYVNYYLIVFDFIDYAKKNGISVGPGRGSGAGSLAAYCMGITNIDPIQYQLLFERFLNPERISMPDFDIDFCYERRQEVIDYVIEKYGADHVAQIVTFGTMAARAAIRDVGRVLDIPYQVVDRVAKMVPMELKMTLEKALSVSKELREECEKDTSVKEMIDMAKRIEGMPRHASTHAAGVVITPQAVHEYVPLATNDGNPVTQFTMTTIEELGLLKMDFLGLRTLTVISEAEKMVQKQNPDFSIETISHEDQDVFAMLNRGETQGVFQMESTGMTQAIMGLRLQSIEDIIAIISLYRPGPMDSIPRYIENRHHPEQVKYRIAQLEPILKVTNGCIIYQEQVMQICRELAGFSYGQADLVRRAMSKKKHDIMEQERRHFVYGNKEQGKECPGCIQNGISEQDANAIYDEMLSFASYAFNKAHAAAYAIVAYQTAYLKCHAPKEFMASLLTSVTDNTNKVIEYSAECQRMGLRVLPPDINESEWGFCVQQQEIRFGLLALKNVGKALIESILKERDLHGPYQSLYDFCKRMRGTDFNRRAVESMIKAGAFDSIEGNRRAMVEALEGILKSVENDARRNLEGQLDFFSQLQQETQEVQPDNYTLPNCTEYPYEVRLQMEKEVSGLYLSGHPLYQYQQEMKQVPKTDFVFLKGEEAHLYDGKQVTLFCTIVRNKTILTRAGNKVAFILAEDLTGSMEIVAFAQILQRYEEKLQENSVVIIRGKVSCREDEETKIVADEIFDVKTYLQKFCQTEYPEHPSKIYLKIPSKQCVQFQKAKNLLQLFSGQTPVYFYIEDINQRGYAPKEFWCAPQKRLFQELELILGKECVVVK